MPKLRWTFIAAIMLGAAAVLATAAFDRHGDAKAHVDAKALVPGVWISEQIGPEQLAALKSRVSVVEGELERLRGLVDRLYGELDIRR